MSHLDLVYGRDSRSSDGSGRWFSLDLDLVWIRIWSPLIGFGPMGSGFPPHPEINLLHARSRPAVDLNSLISSKNKSILVFSL